ncbi:hypothetical protein RRG08_012402 [Elysia crispata]|uniref:Uncharacterized protein n=1 Tax=Elysia crispata TaxID=231223 RepID=A0AAE0YKI9_9GAST|nr:hypothetical protein RRG08_012402 [Elysia crispata]
MHVTSFAKAVTKIQFERQPHNYSAHLGRMYITLQGLFNNLLLSRARTNLKSFLAELGLKHFSHPQPSLMHARHVMKVGQHEKIHVI